MNRRARDFMARLHDIVVMAPGATSVNVHGSEPWLFVWITAASDEAVAALGEAFELTADIGIGEGCWWHRAADEEEQGLRQIVVAGPRHEGEPPADGARNSARRRR